LRAKGDSASGQVLATGSCEEMAQSDSATATDNRTGIVGIDSKASL
jgi:hypothetical protein